MARLSPLRLIALVLVLVAVCSHAASTERISSRALRRVAARGGVDIAKTSKMVLNKIKSLIDVELSDPNKVKPNYIIERQYYNFWTSATLFKVLESALKLPEGSLQDKNSVPSTLDQSEAMVMALVAYGTRHYLRNEIRKREEQRPCMAGVVKLLRIRDQMVYGSGEGPTLQQLITKKYARMNQPVPQDLLSLPKDVALSLVYSAASPNFYVNTLIKFLEQKTGNTLTDEQKVGLMKHAGLTETQIKEVLGAKANGQCGKDDAKDSWVMEFLLLQGYYNEFNDEDSAALTVPPRSKVF